MTQETKVLTRLFFVVAWVFFFCVPAYGDPPSTDNRPTPTSQLFETGKQLYLKQCVVCHGASGRGDGAAAYLLYPKPRDFTRDEYRLISTDTLEATDEDLFRTVTRGMPGSAMPSWKMLMEDQRWALVFYIRYLEEVGEEIAKGRLTQVQVDAGLPWETIQRLITKHADLESMEVPPEPQITMKALRLGKDIYGEACAICHGPTGKGDGQGMMEDDRGFPIRPRDLTAGIFKGSSEGRDLYCRIMAGLPGSPMPDHAGEFTGEEAWALVHYIQSLGPQGTEERTGTQPMVIHVSRVAGEISDESAAIVWRMVKPTYVAVSPLWWRDDRIPGVQVQALQNGKQLALRLSWDDATVNDSALRTQDFPDAVAVQLSSAADPPFFGMGSPGDEVDIWHWKASWQRDVAKHHDVEDVYPAMMVEHYPNQTNWEPGTHQDNSRRLTIHHDPELLTGLATGNPFSNPRKPTAVEDLRAQGPGTLTSRPPMAHRVMGTGQWQDGRWSVVLMRDLTANEESSVGLHPGASISFALAVWDGAGGDRNGRKAVSIWHRLELAE